MSCSIGLQIAVALLVAGERIDRTFKRKSLRIQAHQRLEASQAVDALLQLALPALLHLGAPLRIGKPCPAHADEIDDSAFQESLRNSRLTDRGNADDRDIHVVTDRLDEILSPALREGDRLDRHKASLIQCAADIDEIDSRRFHRLDDPDTILDMDVIFRHADRVQELVDGYTTSEHVILAALLADVCDDLKDQPHTVLEASAVLIGPLVGIRG